ncbi:hypothetical protein KM043_001674 [Ampulex compressa]|nr:hypothetical protein KM043_001674 [Ampulex compressa]
MLVNSRESARTLGRFELSVARGAKSWVAAKENEGPAKGRKGDSRPTKINSKSCPAEAAGITRKVSDKPAYDSRTMELIVRHRLSRRCSTSSKEEEIHARVAREESSPLSRKRDASPSSGLCLECRRIGRKSVSRRDPSKGLARWVGQLEERTAVFRSARPQEGGEEYAERGSLRGERG